MNDTQSYLNPRSTAFASGLLILLQEMLKATEKKKPPPGHFTSVDAKRSEHGAAQKNAKNDGLRCAIVSMHSFEMQFVQLRS